jgi:hypothetical protein
MSVRFEYGVTRPTRSTSRRGAVTINPFVQVDDATAESVPAQEVEREGDVVTQGALAPADDDRAGEQVGHVNQTCGERLTGETCSANGDVADGGPLELPDRLGFEAPLDLLICPLPAAAAMDRPRTGVVDTCARGRRRI